MRLFPAALLVWGCVVPPLSLAGKTCSDSCPAGYSCQSEVCVPDGEGLCDVLDAGSCLDFDHGVGNWEVETVDLHYGGFRIAADGGSVGAGLESATPGLDGGTPGRLNLALPQWSHVTLSFDFFPQLAPANGGDVSIAEVLCASSYQGAWLHYVHGQNAFALLPGPTGVPQAPLSHPPAMGAWSHVVLDATPGNATLSVNDQEAAAVSFDACPSGQWQVTLGLLTTDSTTLHAARFDNAVVNTTP